LNGWGFLAARWAEAESDLRHFRRAGKSDRQSNTADTSIDVELKLPDLIVTVAVFFTPKRQMKSDGRKRRETDLPAMGMT
jgi:hypothetical protein